MTSNVIFITHSSNNLFLTDTNSSTIWIVFYFKIDLIVLMNQSNRTLETWIN